MEARIMALVEESCILSARPDPDDETPVKGEFDLGQVSYNMHPGTMAQVTVSQSDMAHVPHVWFYCYVHEARVAI